MREPPFWWRAAGIEASLLAPVAAIYGAVAASRLSRNGHRAGVPVICIGNPTVGGAGKTPTALAVARMLAGGRRAAGAAEPRLWRAPAGPLVVDPDRHRAADVGDEPLLLAPRGADDRCARPRRGARRLRTRLAPAVIVMDDGFQNPVAGQGLLRAGDRWPARYRQRQGLSSRSAACTARMLSLRAPMRSSWSARSGEDAAESCGCSARSFRCSGHGSSRIARSIAALDWRGAYWPLRASAIRRNSSRRCGRPASRSPRRAALPTITATRRRTRGSSVGGPRPRASCL